MSKDNRTPSAGQSSPVAVRTEGAPDAPPKHGKGTLGYSFIPVPRTLRDAIRLHAGYPGPDPGLDPKARRRELADRLKPVDAEVMGGLLDFPRRLRDSCWCSKETVARKLGKSVRTVQDSLRRLELHGFIARVPAAVPDPDEPGNRTGWRVVFRFIETGMPKPSPQVDRRPPAARKVWQRVGPGAAVASPQTPLFDVPVASPQRQPVASNIACDSELNSDGVELDGETPPSSSSPRASSGPPADRGEDDDEGLASSTPEGKEPGGHEEAAQAALECFGFELARIIRGDARRIAGKIGGRWDCFAAAVYRAHQKRHADPDRRLAYVQTIAKDFAEGGIPEDVTAYRERLRRKAKMAEQQAQRNAEREAARVTIHPAFWEEYADEWGAMAPGKLLRILKAGRHFVTLKPHGGFRLFRMPGAPAARPPDALLATLKANGPAIQAILEAEQAEAEPPQPAAEVMLPVAIRSAPEPRPVDTADLLQWAKGNNPRLKAIALKALADRGELPAEEPPPDAPAIPPPAPPEPEAAPGLLDALGPDDRARFEAAPGPLRRELLKMANAGVNVAFLGYVSAKLRAAEAVPGPAVAESADDVGESEPRG